MDTYSRMDVWLELRTDDLDAALERLADVGVHPCDEIEPLGATGARTRWIKDPAGVVHLLVEDASTTRPPTAGDLARSSVGSSWDRHASTSASASTRS